ncbi:MAG: alginate lyase family protein [Armatimonadetes bacterium]|nr:alginate lyase family protein [Armatimonadota bacterium]
MFSWHGLALVIGLGALMLASNAGASDLRPRVLLNSQELVRLREEVKKDGWKKDLYHTTPNPYALSLGQGIKADADLWLDREIVIPGRSGHFHNFFCDDGNQLEVPSDMKEHPEGYKCPVCGKVYQGERYDGGIRWWEHNMLSRGAFALALTYAIEGDARYAEKAVEILSKYADAYPGPHTSAVEGGIMYQSLCESVWSIPLAWAYDLTYDPSAMTPELREKIEGKLFRPVAAGLKAMGIGGNWGSWHLSATGVIGYAIGDQELIDYAVTSFKSQIANQLGDDGLWPESVHTYHFYPLGAFLYLAEAAWQSGTDLFHWEAKPGKSLKAMFTSPLGYMYPDTRLPAINDGWFNSFLPLDQYELAYLRTGDPEIGWALREGYLAQNAKRAGLWAFLKGDGFECECPKPELRSTNFPVLGIATLRSDDKSMLTFDYGPYLGHGQPDKMGITLWANGKLWVADYGTCGYGSPALAWYRSTAGHNTVIVDGKNQAGTKERKLNCFEGDELFEVAEAETEEAYPGVVHGRTVIRVGGYYVMLDRLTSDSEHTYDWLLRSEGDLRMGLIPSDTSDAPEYAFVDSVRTHSADGKWQARWDLGGQGLGLFMLDQGTYTVASAKCPAETTNHRVPLIISRKTGKSAEFTSVLYPYDGKLYVVCDVEHGLVKVIHDGLTDWIYVGQAEQGSPLTTDGRFALVRVKDGQPLLTRVVGGKTVEWKP